MASIAAVQANSVGATLPSSLLASGGAATGSEATGQFAQLVGSGIGSVNKELLMSQTDLQELAVGNAQNLHQIMMRLEESRLSFQFLMQVRGRLLEAYQDVMKMQI